MADSPPSPDESQIRSPEEWEPSCWIEEPPAEDLRDRSEGEADAAEEGESPAIRIDPRLMTPAPVGEERETTVLFAAYGEREGEEK